MKDVPGYEGIYQASEDGFVYSLISEKFLNPKSKNGWYLSIRLCKRGHQKPIKVHRIIAITFIPNPHGYKDVNHKNGIKTDNRVSNLEWCNRSYNIKHSFRELGRVPVTGVNHPKYKPILNTWSGIYYDSLADAAMSKGLTKDCIMNQIRRGKSEFRIC